MWGTVGSGLTPGSLPDGRTPEIPEPDPEKTGKTGKAVSRPFCSITAEPGHLQTW